MELLAKHTNHPTEKIEQDILRPKYFDPYAAIEYGIIDKASRLTAGLLLITTPLRAPLSRLAWPTGMCRCG